MRRIDLKDHPTYIDVRFDPRLPKPDQFVLCEAIEVVCLPYAWLRLTIPAGFLSDGASVPQVLWSVAPAMDNRVLLAYIVHDFMYGEWETVVHQKPVLGYLDDPRLFSDDVMLGMMNQLAPERSRRNWLYYQAVRLGGGPNWTKFRRQAQTI